MTYHLKAESEQKLYQSLIDAGVIVESTNHVGERVYLTTDSKIKLDLIGVIKTQKYELDLDENDEPQFEITQECISEAQPELLWEQESDPEIPLPVGVSVGDVRVPAKEAVFATHKSDTPKIKKFTTQVTDSDDNKTRTVPVMTPVRMIMPGDVKDPGTPDIMETQIEKPATDDILWSDPSELPDGVSIGDVKTPGEPATYMNVVIEPGIPATYYNTTDSEQSPVAFHANIKGITTTQASKLPVIDTPGNPTRVWLS